MTPSDQDADFSDVKRYVTSFEAGAFVFRESDAGAEMYIVRSGQIELLKQYAGDERQVALLEEGDFFGELSLLEDQPREVSARAVSACELLRIDASTFDRIVQEAPEIPVRMLRKLCRRLRVYEEHEARAAAIAMGPLAQLAKPSPEKAPEPAMASAAERAALLVHTESRTEFDLAGRNETIIGRVDRSTGFAPDIDLTPLDTERTLSRRHAKIIRRDGEYFVREEIGTRNGTFVNDSRLQSGFDVKLANGDRICFGLVETIFELR